MLISKKHKFIFAHIPKTAGMAMRVILEPHADSIENFVRKRQHYNKQIITKHFGAGEIQKLIRPEIWNSYFKFTFVRNPWALMISHYFYFRVTGNRNRNILYRQARDLDFNAYIKWYFSRPPDQSKFILGFSPFIEIDSSIVLDYIGKYENLPNNFLNILKRLKIPQTITLPIKNKTEHKHYTYYYNERTKKMVERAFMKHLRRFSYGFNNNNSM